MTSPGMYAKAIIGALVAGLGALTAGLADGTLSLVEGITAVTAGLAALGVVYVTPNEEKPDDRGVIDVGLIVSIIVGVILALLLYQCFADH